MRHTKITLAYLLSFLSFTSEAVPNYRFHICSEKTTFMPNTTYQYNLNSLLSSLSSNAMTQSGFYNTSTGKKPGSSVYGLFLCRGDLTTHACQDCVVTATKVIVDQYYCPIEKEAVIWYDECMLRYSNRSIFSVMEDQPRKYFWSVIDIAVAPDHFLHLAETTLNDLVHLAVNSSGAKKFATKEAKFTEYQTLYSHVQCTPDLSSFHCNKCLGEAITNLPMCCNGKQGGRVLYPSCNIRYEIYPFYQIQAVDAPVPAPAPAPALTHILLPPPPAPGSTTRPKEKERKKIPTAIIIVVPSVIAIMMLTISICIFQRVRKSKDNFETVDEIKSVESLQFDFSTIRAATNNFSDTNELGKGGFGVVYKGKLSNGHEIAVKRLSRNSQQGDLEFKNEVLLVAKLQHRNLVRLLGFCLEGKERLLIYEFVPNRSLNYYIFDPMKPAHINWERRYKIIIGIARGLLYLHEDSRLRIIHRDLKASNVLLDAEMNPKISDFGMAKMFVLDQTEGTTNRIVGTYGYMAPEYAMLGQFSVKSDVYSFGVLILEVVSGQKITCFHDGENTEYLLSYAWKNWMEETTSNLMDPTLREGPISEIMRCIKIGLLCVQENVIDRPSMTSVVLMLNGNFDPIPTPTQPASFMRSNVVLSTSVQHDIGSHVTNNEVSITELCPR